MFDRAADGLLLYSCLYFGAIAAVATWEGLSPRRALARPLRRRWLANFGVTAIDSALVRVLLPFTSMGAAAVAADRGIGLLNQLAVPPALGWFATFVALDASRYAQHVALHRVPALWRLHRVHHTDADYDFTTGLRFHPIESLLTTCIALITVFVLGLPVVAVCAYELVFTGVAFFAHANVRLPTRTDRWLRLLVVTPDLHRVHHSASEIESHSNFSGVFPWWDHALGTYRAAPALGHDAMRVGLSDFTDPRHERLTWMLANPFLESRASAAPVSEIAAGG